MSVLTKLAYLQNRRDEAANEDLERELVEKKDTEGIKTLIIVASVDEEYNRALFPLLTEHLKECRPKSIPQYAEGIMRAVTLAISAFFLEFPRASQVALLRRLSRRIRQAGELNRSVAKKSGNIIMRKKITIISTICITLLTIFCGVALSHPHVFITQKIKIVFDNQGLAGFKIHWTFDDMFTSMIAGDYDKNQNEVLEKSEVALIKKEAFSYLFHYNYFTFVKIDGKPFNVKFIQNFSAELQDKKLIYKFFIPCHVTATSNFKHVTVVSYDPSYYSAIFFANNGSVSSDNFESFKIKTAIQEDTSTSIYYGQVNPWALFLDFRIKQ